MDKLPEDVQAKAWSSFERADLEMITENYAQQIIAADKKRKKLKRKIKALQRIINNPKFVFHTDAKR